jgi:hypothetical protein
MLRPETARWWALSVRDPPVSWPGSAWCCRPIVFLGLLWPVLRGRERAIFVLLAAGFVSIAVDASLLDRLATPLDPGARRSTAPP